MIQFIKRVWVWGLLRPQRDGRLRTWYEAKPAGFKSGTESSVKPGAEPCRSRAK